ncbi:MAG: kelch repeat-containing protein [Acidobacteriota bacterium]
MSTRAVCAIVAPSLFVLMARGQQWLPGVAAPREFLPQESNALAFDPTRGVTVTFGGMPVGSNPIELWELAGSAWSAGAMVPAALRGRMGSGMAYDDARATMVIFGGSFANDTWEYDGVSYTMGPPPPPGLLGREMMGMAYDSARGVTVLFGGAVTLYTAVNDTWEYDGTAWVPGPSSPPGLVARYGHGLVFDSARGVCVLFGGSQPSGMLLDDTWEYDGLAWTAGPAAPPSLVPRGFLGMAYDAGRARTVIHGGWDGTHLSDTWEYDGAAWTQGPAGPVRERHALSYDPTRGKVLLHGGRFVSSPRDDLWEYDGVRWALVNTTSTPGLMPRLFHAMTFDSARSQVVLFGGNDGFQSFSDTWEYDGASWRLGPPAPPALTPRSTAMTYDALRRRTVLFGGADAAAYLADTWEYDGASWTPGPAPSPGLSARCAHAMAFDSRRARTVLFGGLDATGLTMKDTWEYDGASWLPGATAPPALGPRYFHVLAFDSARNLVVMFGGSDMPLYGACYRDTWLYDGAAWFPGPAPAPGLPALVFAAMAYDAARGRVILYGGGDCASSGWAQDDTWELDAGGWLPGPAAPAGLWPASFHGMAYDATRQAVVLFGGQSNGGNANDTWELSGGCPGVFVTPPSLPPASPASVYGQTLAASGGVGPYVFAVTSGALPGGIGLSATGALGGTPTDTGAFPFSVTATDATGCTGSKAYVINVRSPVDYVVGAGLGPPNPNEVKVYDAGGTAAPVDFFAFAAGGYGANVASGDLDLGGLAEILAAPGPGPAYGPQVRAFRRDGSPIAKVNFYAYATLKFGANVASASVDGDAFDEILTGAGPGAVFGAHVRAFDVDGGAVRAISKCSFLAYGTAKFGVNVNAGDLDADGYAEVVTGTGPGPTFAPTVRGWNFDGVSLGAIAKVNFPAFVLAGFGVHVAAGQVDLDPYDEILCSPGPRPSHPSRFLGFTYDGQAVAQIPGFDVTPYPTGYGGNVGSGNLAPETVPTDELITGAGRDPAASSEVCAYRRIPGGLALVGSFTPFLTTYGVNVSSGPLAY